MLWGWAPLCLSLTVLSGCSNTHTHTKKEKVRKQRLLSLIFKISEPRFQNKAGSKRQIWLLICCMYMQIYSNQVTTVYVNAFHDYPHKLVSLSNLVTQDHQQTSSHLSGQLSSAGCWRTHWQPLVLLSLLHTIKPACCSIHSWGPFHQICNMQAVTCNMRSFPLTLILTLLTDQKRQHAYNRSVGVMTWLKWPQMY